MKRLNGMDAMLLYTETPNLHTHTLKVAVISPRDQPADAPDFGFDTFRTAVERRLPLLPPLRYRLVDTPFRMHHPMWLEDCEVDLDYHLRRVQVPSPGGRRELDRVIGQIASTPLDRGRPLWEFHLAEGLTGGRFALIGKVHHALADGVASANLIARLLNLAGPVPEQTPDRRPEVRPSKAALLRAAGRDHVQQLAALPGVARDSVRGLIRVRRRARRRRDNTEMARLFQAPPTFLNHVVSPTRTFATAALSLAAVKETARHLDVTFNDIVLASAAGALRELLLRYDGRADRPLLASVPVSTDKSADRICGNEIGGLAVSLPAHIDDPLQRVRLTALASARAKENNDLLGPTLQGRIMAYLPTAVVPPMFAWQSKHAAHNRIMNVAVSNVPGPRERGDIAGAPVTEFYSVGVLSAGSAFNMTVWSYVDQLDISVLSDDSTFADVHEATDAMVNAFGEIRRAAGLSDGRSAVATAMPPAGVSG